MIYEFEIKGHPVSKSNFKPKGGGFSKESKAQWAKYAEYEKHIKGSVFDTMREKGWKTLEGPVNLLIVLWKSWDRGDTPNYPKSICDALNEVAYKDDKQIKVLGVIEAGIDKNNPRIFIKLSEISGNLLVKVGDLEYNGSVPQKIKAKRSDGICTTCGESLYLQSLNIGGSSIKVRGCRNFHYFS